MNLPTLEECYAILKKYQTPTHIINHSKAVNKVSRYLAEKFMEAGISVNIDLIDKASLLHDVVRLTTLGHHAEVGAKIFEADFPEMAKVIAKHRLSAILSGNLKTWEEKIVYYADKRVNHDQLVSIEERMKEGRKRWRVQKSDDEHELILKKMKELENEIFSIINKKPSIINEL